MNGIPGWRRDEIQRGRDPDSLSRERARDEAFQRTQRAFGHELEYWKLDTERDRRSFETADGSREPPPVTLHEDFCCVG